MKLAHLVIMALSVSALSGCFGARNAASPSGSVSHTALAKMERVALGARQCWFKSGDPEFRKYTLSPELNSFSGRPRILIVPARNPNDRPVLVVQAEGNPGQMERFGPLMQTSLSERIARDTERWASGQRSC